MKNVILAALGLLVVTPAFAQDAGKATEEKTGSGVVQEGIVAQTDDKDERICKYQARTGTRFKKKVCRTAKQWEAIAEAAKSGLGEMQRQPIGMPDGST